LAALWKERIQDHLLEQWLATTVREEFVTLGRIIIIACTDICCEVLGRK